jgi:hypothetical protein
MVLFEHILKKYFPRIDLSYVPQNISHQTVEDRMTWVQRLKEKIGDDVYALLILKKIRYRAL